MFFASHPRLRSLVEADGLFENSAFVRIGLVDAVGIERGKGAHVCRDFEQRGVPRILDREMPALLVRADLTARRPRVELRRLRFEKVPKEGASRERDRSRDRVTGARRVMTPTRV